MTRLPRLALLAFVSAVSCQAGPPAPATPVWDNWRGPDATAIATHGDPPIEWSETKNVRWKAKIPGAGSSSPIVWGDRVYVATAIETDTTGVSPIAPKAGERFAGPTPTKVHKFVVVAIDRNDGSIAWQRTVVEAVPHEGLHQTMTQAAHSPLTDGEHIYAYFGSRGLHCLDMAGTRKWSKQFGYMRTRREWGEGSSPALHGNTLVVNWDHEGADFVVALDKRTGDELWRKQRDEPTSWATPLVVEVDGRAQVILAATKASRGYDLATGELIWSCSGMTVNCIPTPVHSRGIVYLMSGYRGKMLQALRLSGARGDVTDSAHVLWRHVDATPYVPSSLLYDGRLFFLRGNSAVLSCLDATTGAVHFEGAKLRGLKTVYSSPVGAAGRIYITDRGGVTKVLKAGTTYEELATNQLDDEIDGTAAIVDDTIYFRGRTHLYAISRK